MNKFKLICGLGIKLKFLWSQIPLWWFEIIKHSVFMFCKFFLCLYIFSWYMVFVFWFLCYWVWILMCCRWVHFGLDLVYHLRFYLLCVVCVMTMIIIGVDVVMHDNSNMINILKLKMLNTSISIQSSLFFNKLFGERTNYKVDTQQFFHKHYYMYLISFGLNY